MTPLHLAVFYGFSDCCQKLLSSGKNHIQYIWQMLTSKIIALSHCFDIKPDICHPSKNVCLSNKHLLLAGFDINTVDSQGRTCLHVAASGGYAKCLPLMCL